MVSVEGPNDEEIVSEKALGLVLDSNESDESSMSSTIKKTEKKVAKKITKPKTKVVKRKTTTRSKTKGKGPLDDAILEAPRKVPAPKPKKQEGDEEVTEVKMKTGTLFIYRGSNHRVEFIRTV